MNKKEIIKYIKENCYGISSLPDMKIIESIEKSIDEYHANHELDLELIIYESLLLLIPPIADYIKSLELLKKVNTNKTTILKAIIQYNNMGFIDKETSLELIHYLDEENDNHSKSIFCYLLSLNNGDENEKLNYLDKSIFYNPEIVLGYIELSDIYKKKKELELSNQYLKKGLDNIKKIINQNDKIDIADYDFFIRESIIGDIITVELFNYWQSKLKI